MIVRRLAGLLAAGSVVAADLVQNAEAMEPSGALVDRWFRDSVVMGSWVDASWKPTAKKSRVGKGPITWLHLGPTADCPHRLPGLPDFGCMDHWVASTDDDDPVLGIRWDSSGWGADLLYHRWVIYIDRKTGNGSDSVDGPRVVGRLKMRISGLDTTLEVVYGGRKSTLVRGPRPEAYEGNLPDPDLDKDRLWFDTLHRAHLAPVGLAVPDPVRCLLSAHASRPPNDTAAADTNCLISASPIREGRTLTWADPMGRWKVERDPTGDATDPGFRDRIQFRLPDLWRWIWWERREEALRDALTFVAGMPPHRSMAMENPRLLFRTGEKGCRISGRETRDTLPWFSLEVVCR